MFRFLFALIGYVATATVITLALGFGYLWHTDRLNDERIFRILALLQGVDIDQIAAAEKAAVGEVPPEEPSMDDLAGHEQVADRNYEVKLFSLRAAGRNSTTGCSCSRRSPSDSTAWPPNGKTGSSKKTSSPLKRISPKWFRTWSSSNRDMAKKLLKRWIDENRMEDVILLLGRMSENKKGKILKSFTSRRGPQPIARDSPPHDRPRRKRREAPTGPGRDQGP